jgi:phage terminase large subunit GpA-like protein
MQPALINHSIPLLDAFPASLAGREINFDLPRQLRLVMRHPEKIKVSEWAAQYRVVSDGAHEGPWRHEYAPHTVKVMDTFGLPWVREVWFCGVEQSGKTNTMINCIGWAIDCDPGGIFYLMPTEDTAAKVTSGKLRPTLQKSPRLARYLSTKEADTTLARINLTHGVTIWPAHANSASSMATWTAKHCFGDEVDKYPAQVGKEADPITLIKKRNRNYKGRYKRFFSSTPAGLFIYKGVQNCHQVWEYRLKCPHCEEYIKLDADHLVIPEQATPEQIEREGCGYACNECGTVWDDQTREHAIRLGHWYCVQGADNPRPHKVGFHHRAWECLDITLAEIGAAWLRAKQGDHSAKVAWANGYEAIDYEAEKAGTLSTDHLLRFKSELPRNLVPPDTARLWLLVDTQQSSFYYQLWAAGFAPDVNLHMVRHGIVESFADLEGLLDATWRDADGKEYRITNGLIDSGGTRKGWQKHSRTVEVYDWCSRNRVVMPHKGMHGRTGDLISYKDVATFPGTNKKIPGGLKRANLRVDIFKDELERRLAMEPDDTGALSFHCDIDEQFSKHYTTEIKDEHGDWQHYKSKGRNDYWDCTVYALALREMLKLRMPRKEQPATTGRRIFSKGVGQ